MMVCEDLKSGTLTAISCSSGALVHEGRFKRAFAAAEFAVNCGLRCTTLGVLLRLQPFPPLQQFPPDYGVVYAGFFLPCSH
jgi:hypothetical protein